MKGSQVSHILQKYEAESLLFTGVETLKAKLATDCASGKKKTTFLGPYFIKMNLTFITFI